MKIKCTCEFIDTHTYTYRHIHAYGNAEMVTSIVVCKPVFYSVSVATRSESSYETRSSSSLSPNRI